MYASSKISIATLSYEIKFNITNNILLRSIEPRYNKKSILFVKFVHKRPKCEIRGINQFM